MQDIKVIRNYTSALFNDPGNKQKDKILKHLEKILETINLDVESKGTLYSPAVSKIDKARLVNELTSILGTPKVLSEFLQILIRNSRENILDYLPKYYKQMLDASKNIKQVKIKSFKALSDKDKESLIKYLKTNLIKCDIEINYEEDSSLLGGILIQYDNNIMDFSIAGALKKIDDIAGNAIVK